MSDVRGDAKAIFLGALDCQGADELVRFIDQACGTDAALRTRVEELIRAHREAGAFLGGASAPVVTVDEPLSEVPGTVIGPYKLLEQIGEGGFGVVYMAEQTQPVRRKVALKILKPGMDTRQVVARFEAERQALAIMDHPNIAKVFDGGSTEPDAPARAGADSLARASGSGRPYFVMELVKGVPITDFCDQNHLTPRQRLELFVPVCQAVQHAHQKGIIHRDLKPSNVLVTLSDGQPSVKVIDFGIAKATGGQLTDKTLFTGFAQMIGTPLYMSPEQAGQSLDIDTRSDIYSLGVLLYELLTGTTPFSKERFKQAGYDEIRRIIREEEPPKPSTRLSESKDSLPSISAQRQTEPAKLMKLVRGELDWIVMKALEKDRNRRYETANGFAMDVQRYLADEPVAAGPPSTWYRFRKFARRNKRTLATLALVGMMLLLAVGLLIYNHLQIQAEQIRTKAEKDRAEENFDKARSVVDKMLTRMGEGLASEPHLEHMRRDLLEQALRFYQGFLQEKSTEPEVRQKAARAYWMVGQIHKLLGQHASAEPNWDQAIGLFRQLIDDYPEVDQYRQDLANCQTGRANLLIDLGRPQEAEKVVRQAIALHEGLLQRDATAPNYRESQAGNYRNLGNLLTEIGRHGEAEAAYRNALALAEALAAEFPNVAAYRQEVASGHLNRGLLLRQLGRSADAETALREAIRLLKPLTSEFPRVPGYRGDLAVSQNNLAAVLLETARLPEAEAALGEAITLYGPLVTDFPKVPGYQHGLARGRGNLGVVLFNTGRREQAVGSYQQSVTAYEQLIQRSSNVPAYRQELADHCHNLGNALAALGRAQEAEKAFARALEHRRELRTRYPAVPAYRQGLAGGFFNQAVFLHDLGRHREAEEAYREAIALFEPLVAEFSRVPFYRQVLGWSLTNLANLLAGTGREAEAEPVHRQALATKQRLVAEFPSVSQYRHDLATGHNGLGVLLTNVGRFQEAITEYQEALRLTPDDPDVQRKLAWVWATHPDLQSRDIVQAVELGKKAVTGQPQAWKAWQTLGVAHYRAGDWMAAVTALEKAMGLEKGKEGGYYWFFLAMAHWQLGHKERAREFHAQSLQWLEKSKSMAKKPKGREEERNRIRDEAAELIRP